MIQVYTYMYYDTSVYLYVHSMILIIIHDTSVSTIHIDINTLQKYLSYRLKMSYCNLCKMPKWCNCIPQYK